MHQSTIFNESCCIVLHVLRDHARLRLHDNDDFGGVVLGDAAIEHLDAFGLPTWGLVVIELVNKVCKWVADV